MSTFTFLYHYILLSLVIFQLFCFMDDTPVVVGVFTNNEQ